VFFAAGRLGAIFVPFNTRLSAPEIAYLLADADPRVLFHGPDHAELIGSLEPAAARTDIAIAGSGPDSYDALVSGAAGGAPD
jgi:fatty-acyl-CoA synthase